MFIPRTLTEISDGRPGRAAVARAIVVAAVVTAALFLILSANITLGQEDLEAGQIAERDIRAPRDITFDSVTLTRAARDAAAADVPAQTVTAKAPADNLAEQLTAFDSFARGVTRVLNLRDRGTLSIAQAADRISEDAPEVPSARRTFLAQLPAASWEAVAAEARRVIEATLADSIRQDELPEVRDEVRNAITADLAPDERALAGDVAAAFIEPTEIMSAELTAQERDRARAAVNVVEHSVETGQAIVRLGDPIDELAFETLEELGLTQQRTESGTIVGNALIAALIAGLLVAYLMRFQPEIWHRNRSVFLFFLALVVTAVALRVSADRALWAFLVPTSAAVLLVGILLHGGAGAAMAVALGVLAGVMNRDALDPAAYAMAGGLVSLLTITNAERLNAFFRVGAFLVITNILVVTAFSLVEQRELSAIAQLAVAGALNAGLSVVLAIGSFAVLGNVFGIMTVFQLLELANPSNRLLRRLLLETPGTYHHSVMVGNLAERAAETIGADPLLARVAAYYHDVGKMKNPLAFIENQGGAHNIHDDLTAETSARIIAGHIRDGIDLAYEHNLPVQVIGFIPQHHGTSVMSYFHDKALREVGGRQDLVDDRTYRYPGPKPQSREAAIIMLADGVEASVRSLDDKDEASIRAMVDRIVDARLEDGQLDDAELTLKNIAQIKEAFVAQLLGMYHSRIKYPDNVVPMETRERA
jgi:cyclic-di-AMP phosphodiesterase PgpH